MDKTKQLLHELTPEQAEALIADGTISGGMIPKVETCVAAVEGGVGGAVILDGKLPHVMLLEIFTQRGVGTLFKRS
jgi:acetylglutamate kinase